MIQKHLSRKGGTGQLVKYVTRYIVREEKIKKPKEKSEAKLILRHNIRSRSVPGYVREFELNEQNRIVKRKDSVKVFHSILSFSNKDKEHIDEKMLKDLAKKYVSLRGKENLYVIAAHLEKEHTHMHIVMSGTQLNGRSSRMSKQQLHSLKLAMDKYQAERYEKLVNSLPQHGRKQHEKNIEALQNAKRNERATSKNEVLRCLDTAFTKASSREEFFSLLEKDGYTAYNRNGVITGLQQANGMKFRLGRNGYTETKLEELNQRNEQANTLKELQALRQGQQRHMMRDILKEEPQQEAPERSQEEAAALEELSSIRESAGRDNSRGREIEHDEPEEEGLDYSPSQNETDEDDY